MSHPKPFLAAVVLVLLSAAHAGAEPAVTGTKLKLREGPGPAFAVIKVLEPGTRLELRKCTDVWCRVQAGRLSGYVSSAFIKTGKESFASAAPQAEPAPVKPTLTGPRISRWRDSEWRDAHWRDLEWRSRIGRH